MTGPLTASQPFNPLSHDPPATIPQPRDSLPSRARSAHLTPEIGPSVTVSGGAVVVMTIRVMSSGMGYEYLLKSVAAGDGNREMSSPLTRYYTETGSPPGTWVGTGLMSLDDGRTPALAEGDTVTEEHLARQIGRASCRERV